MDKICIKKLEVFGNHGVLKEENVLGQKFVISAVLECDIRKAGKTDDLQHTLNYAQVCECIEKEVKRTKFQLIERLATYLANYLLLHFSEIVKVELEIEKPWAPVHAHLDTVSIKISRGWEDVYLGIGSNMGDKEENLNKSIQLLQENELTEVLQVSKFIETAPVGYEDQDDFLNGAVHIRTLLSPEEMLEEIGMIEEVLKRERTIHWGPRTIDVDILLYGNRIVQRENLVIPHVEMANRLFVLEPLCEIAPYVLHPVLGKRMVELKNALEF